MKTYVDQYPTWVLAGSKTALILFAAAFGGRQDAAFIAEAGLTATCVDEDGDKLHEMQMNYPDDWAFIRGDVFQFVDEQPNRSWDIVSADPFTHDFKKTADILQDLCLIARHSVIVGVGADTVLEVPYGWVESPRMHRSDYAGGVYWAVLERK